MSREYHGKSQAYGDAHQLGNQLLVKQKHNRSTAVEQLGINYSEVGGGGGGV